MDGTCTMNQVAVFGSSCCWLKMLYSVCKCLKKNHNAPRPSEHPPVRGEKISKRLGGINFVPEGKGHFVKKNVLSLLVSITPNSREPIFEDQYSRIKDYPVFEVKQSFVP